MAIGLPTHVLSIPEVFILAHGKLARIFPGVSPFRGIPPVFEVPSSPEFTDLATQTTEEFY